MPRFAQDSNGRNVVGGAIAALIAIAFSFLLLAHDPLIFWNDDYEISILPVCADMARAWRHAEFPLLSPFSWVCGNLAGEFQYGVFSIFINALIIFVWKLPLLFPQQAAVLAITHLAVLSGGGFSYTVLMLALVLVWLTIRELAQSHKLMTVAPLILGASLGFAMANPAWWALLDYTQGSARAVPDLAAHSQWLVPWKAWPGL